MILLNSVEVPFDHFPDGTLMMNNFPVDNIVTYNTIKWLYESEEELIVLMYVVSHIRNIEFAAHISLVMPYIPNARMDRTKHTSEVFTLKYFAQFINSLNFDNVFVLDPHSDVSAALLNNVSFIPTVEFIGNTIMNINDREGITSQDKLIIYFPDAGAYKRYKDMTCFRGYECIYGQKIRNWENGKIEGLKIVDANGEKLKNDALSGKVVLMVDDIISYGGTMHYSAVELTKLGAKVIYAYATHVEKKSLWDEEKGTFGKDLKYDAVKHLYTTNSIYNEETDSYVTVFNI